jgi:hypothetical protein
METAADVFRARRGIHWRGSLLQAYLTLDALRHKFGWCIITNAGTIGKERVSQWLCASVVGVLEGKGAPLTALFILILASKIRKVGTDGLISGVDTSQQSTKGLSDAQTVVDILRSHIEYGGRCGRR